MGRAWQMLPATYDFITDQGEGMLAKEHIGVSEVTR